MTSRRKGGSVTKGNRTGWNTIPALVAAFLCAAIIVLTLGCGARGDARQAAEELEQRDVELALTRAKAEQARQQLEGRNRELTSRIAELEEERDQLQGSIKILARGWGSLPGRAPNLPGQGAEPVGSVAPSVEPAQEPVGDTAPDSDPALVAENSSLKGQVQQLEGEGSRLTAENTALKAAHQSLAGVEARTEELRATIASLEQQEAGLRAVIAALEEDRKALAVQANEMFPVCSGSMEPKITCLDTVVLLENFLPEDIEVGTVISFIPPPDEEEPAEESIPVLHRVAEIKQEGGIHYYWPKGDAWENPDGYWIPQSSVIGYVIELLPGTRPGNAALRDLVNRSRERYVNAKERMVAARNRYDQAAITHCGSLEAPTSCQTDENGRSQVTEAHTQFTQAWKTFVAAACGYDKAYFHGLRESEPRDTEELIPYVAPASCTGGG